MLSAPTRQTHPELWWQIPLWGLGHHQVKPSPMPGWEGGSSSDTQCTHSWGKLASCWAHRESWDTRRSPRGTAEETPEQGEPLHPILHFLTNKDAVNLSSRYNWPRLYSCQEKKLLKILRLQIMKVHRDLLEGASSPADPTDPPQSSQHHRAQVKPPTATCQSLLPKKWKTPSSVH